MTFTQTVKYEILKNLGKMDACCRKALLSAFIRSTGSIGFNAKGFGLTFYSKNEQLASYIERLIKEYDNCNYVIKREKRTGLLAIEVSEPLQILRDCGIITTGTSLELVDGIFPPFTSKECCAKNYLIGLFLGCGTVKVPISDDLQEKVKGGYHLEIALYSFELALDAVHLLEEFGFDAGLGYRKEKQLVYFKDGEVISDLLAFFGARNGVMTIQNSMAARSIRAEANRTSNCINANIDRAVEAAGKQLAAIAVLKEKVGLENLSPQMRETAVLRLENPDANLEDLTALHHGVSKSGVNHRLRAIVKLAKEQGGDTNG